MAIKKSDLYSSRWASWDELRGGTDASQYKDYVLFMLFIKNITDKYGEGKDMVEKLSNLVGIFQKAELDFIRNRAEHDDILGDAYEYLMRHFATESGKSKSQFYTPSEVSRVIAKVTGISPAGNPARQDPRPQAGDDAGVADRQDATGMSALTPIAAALIAEVHVTGWDLGVPIWRVCPA